MISRWYPQSSAVLYVYQHKLRHAWLISVLITRNRLILMNKWFAGCGNVKLFELHKKKSWQVCDWLAKWLIMLGFMDLRWLRVFRHSDVGLVCLCFTSRQIIINIMHMLCLHTNFNSLWPSYAIWRHRTGATLVQIMAPGHHPNQHWLIISKDQWKSPGGNFHKKYLSHQSLKMTLKITNPKFHSTLPGANESIINACTTFICLHLRWKKKKHCF